MSQLLKLFGYCMVAVCICMILSIFLPIFTWVMLAICIIFALWCLFLSALAMWTKHKGYTKKTYHIGKFEITFEKNDID